MPRPYVVGWYYAFKTLYDWKKKHGWRVTRRRMKLWKQMLRKKYFWRTPKERAEEMRKFLDGIREMGRTVHEELHVARGISVPSCGWCNPRAGEEDDEEDLEVSS
ncbi:hypothetical protein [Alicyclobacillus shizuokensis]|uniref:hypothetical protein n=1 Tax=Alicyclobacillus shizuokensis TaxID=392014 RepID=UPI00082CCBF5|nr:hypothetical protein [Alicyclobacillus shizuokensis]